MTGSDGDSTPAATPASPPALRLEPIKGPAGWLLMTGNRAGWARLADLCRVIADSVPGTHEQGTPLESGDAFEELFTPDSRSRIVNELFTPYSSFRIHFCAVADDLGHQAGVVEEKKLWWRDRRALVGCGAATLLLIMIVYVFIYGAVSLVRGQ